MSSTPSTSRLLRLAEVEHEVGLTSSSIYRFVKAGTFPAPVKLSPACVRWRQEDIARWKAALQPAAGETPPPLPPQPPAPPPRRTQKPRPATRPPRPRA